MTEEVVTPPTQAQLNAANMAAVPNLAEIIVSNGDHARTWNGRNFVLATNNTSYTTQLYAVPNSWIAGTPPPPPTTYTVTFNSAGGSSVASETVTSGTSIEAPLNPTWSGYTFEGWGVTFPLVVTANITLTAQWTAVVTPPPTTNFTITFNSEGGSSISSITVTSGTATALPSSTYAGNTFTGWSTSPSGTILTSPYTPTANVTLYAEWTPVVTPPANGIPPAPTSAPAGYKTVLIDTFAGTKLNTTNWYEWTGEPGGESAAYWETANIVVNNGLSLLTSGPTKLPNGNTGYISGGIGSAIAQTYGIFQVCCQMPQVNGISFLALMWPDDGTWPIDGEIDFLESGSGPFNMTLHYGSNNSQTAVSTGNNPDGSNNFDWSAYHVWGIEWTAGQILATVDGVVWGTIKTSNVPSGPMNLDIQAENVGANQTITNASFNIAWAAIFEAA